MIAEPEFCPAKLACDARLAELEAENEKLRRRTTDASRVLDIAARCLRGRCDANDRLAAVIALCDSDLYCDSGSMFCHDVRAAATGDTK